MTADVDVLIVGGGHAGLATAAWLRRRGRDVLIVDANDRVGEPWRARWASLRLFTPRFVNGLPGMPFPDGADPFPRKDEVADYHERFASHLGAPFRLGARVDRVTPAREGFDVRIAGGETIRARRVVLANGAHHTPYIPPFASKLGPAVLQLHSRDYGRFGALPPGPVVVVGARNSGVEIAMDLAASHEVHIAMSKRPRYAPHRWRSPAWWRIAQFRSWLLRGAIVPGPWPWPIKPPGGRWVELDLDGAERDGLVRLLPRGVDATADALRLTDGQQVRPRTVIWATGFRVDDSWVDVPQEDGAIRVRRNWRGPVPGLWINRAALLGPLRWGAIGIAADVSRSR